MEERQPNAEGFKIEAVKKITATLSGRQHRLNRPRFGGGRLGWGRKGPTGQGLVIAATAARTVAAGGEECPLWPSCVHCAIRLIERICLRTPLEPSK